MGSQWVRPTPPETADSLAVSWMRAQSALPQGWWVSLSSEYGAAAWWIAEGKVPQGADELEMLEAVADTPEAALDALAAIAAAQAPPACSIPSVTPPSAATGARDLADAWEKAVAALPPGWWIASLDGYEGMPDEPGWCVTANGGPDAHYDGTQGFGPTPEAALRDLASTLGR